MAFRSWFSLPLVKADDEDELVDPQETLRDKCREKKHIESLFNKYQKCNDRVNGKSNTTETCIEELFDYVAELDHCVAHTLFSKLK
ncbi:cytochrome b-c1 complex subunit 6, mitochondrial-like [Drosophila serrata]|uniref:cytochrome b-c1 complex subunit 6, mitochondrial-like n=1 Tax=Drosophila serrata TaxID=7274 RepID=UPI000A1D315C|nr:cytochrome b-c1 complex subunit 6, mitochondrial-like [Drosophila serrata]